MSDLFEVVFGAALGGVVTWLASNRAEKRKSAVELYAHFASQEMERVRHAASKFLRTNQSNPQPLTYQQLHDACSDEALAPVTMLIQFWEKTSHLLDTGYVDPVLTRRFLRHYFESHYRGFLRDFRAACTQRPDTDVYLRWTKVIDKLAVRWNVSVTAE